MKKLVVCKTIKLNFQAISYKTNRSFNLTKGSEELDSYTNKSLTKKGESLINKFNFSISQVVAII